MFPQLAEHYAMLVGFLTRKLQTQGVPHTAQFIKDITAGYDLALFNHIWIDQDKWGALEGKLMNFLKVMYPNIKIWQNASNVKANESYLCSIDLDGICGDIVHVLRNGETHWTISGDYDLRDEDLIEVLCKAFFAKN